MAPAFFAPLAFPIHKKKFGKEIKFANVIHTEEKGSDVNLAIHLLNDAWLDKYDCAVVASNDGDLVEALRIVKEDLKKKVGLMTPWRYYTSKDLLPHTTFTKRIRKGILSACQLPDPIPGTTLRKPASW
ncbi:MAG: NYN domain-containing protein [Desulfobacterales bacterium]|nr:NYN domain-containing protein [Desulfobacterales bacterium]